eukprot:CAMPEP_0180416898 /NCGR_PEP_ID=MMETSP1036_2-20121128/737_1 /TAXON_ID=632150 /ORGANISM="Azadinium spinosum, Strain 3D9" /LENGTH=121 /DNA_ID=CAMNT_0022421875 /DNA_START=360 /DNA_END=725 /DNA_ORIENTATION=+
MTLTPIAASLGLQIDMSHGGEKPGVGPGGGNAGAAQAILQTLNSTGGPLLVAWEHFNIESLIAELGVPESDVPVWEESDYDSVYALSFDRENRLTAFGHLQENFSSTALLSYTREQDLKTH